MRKLMPVFSAVILGFSVVAAAGPDASPTASPCGMGGPCPAYCEEAFDPDHVHYNVTEQGTNGYWLTEEIHDDQEDGSCDGHQHMHLFCFPTAPAPEVSASPVVGAEVPSLFANRACDLEKLLSPGRKMDDR